MYARSRNQPYLLGTKADEEAGVVMGDLPVAAAVKPLNGEYTPPGEAWGGPAAAGETKGLCPALNAEVEEDEGAAVEEAKALMLGGTL